MFADLRIAPPPGSLIGWGSPLTQGLVGCWVPQGGARLFDAAGRRTLTPTGSASSVGSPYGLAARNAAGAYWTGPTLDGSFATGATFAALLRVRGTVGAPGSFLLASATATNNLYSIGLYTFSDDLLFFRRNGGGAAVNVGTGARASNTWYLLAGTWDGSSIAVWLDGRQVASAASTGATQTATLSTVAAVWNSNVAPVDLAMGAAWSRPLTAAEIGQLAAEPFAMFARSTPELWAATQQQFRSGWLARTPVLGSGVY